MSFHNSFKKIMIQKRQILVNAVMSVIQVVVNGGTLIILYRFLLNTIGVERLGIWAVVLSTTSVALIANSGLSGSVVKFVAKYVARGQDETVSNVIQTVTISVGILLGFILLTAYPLANWLFGLVIPVANLRDALSILPYSLLSLWIMAIAGVFNSSIDGYQRIDLRSILLIASSLFYLLLCFLMVPAYGLMGLAYAQVIQAFILLIGSWFLLKRCMRSLPIFPYKWDRKLFNEIVGYGLNFQVISISQMFYEPITKALLAKFGGLAMTGFYEMARGMIYQLRTLFVAAAQVLLPTIADLQEKNPENIQKVYKDSYRLVLYFAIPFFSLIIALTPIISQLWIGKYENVFVRFSTWLAVGWFISTLMAPASFVILGIGKLRWYTIGNVTIGVLNLGLGLLLGNIYGGTAVVAAWVFSLSLGSLIAPISYHYSYKIPIPMIELLPKESTGIGLASIAGLSICLVLYYQLELTLLAMAAILVLIFFSIVVIPFLLHPMSKRLMGWIKYELLKKSN